MGGTRSASLLQTKHKAVRVQVAIQNMQFKPSALSVHVGDTIVFTNKDIFTHDVTEEDTKAWTSGPLPSGHSFTLIAKEKTRFFCSIHPVMKGSIALVK